MRVFLSSPGAPKGGTNLAEERKTLPEPVVLPDVATEPHPTGHADAEGAEKPAEPKDQTGT